VHATGPGCGCVEQRRIICRRPACSRRLVSPPRPVSAQQVGERAIKALLAADDRDLRSHSLTALLRELDGELAQRWQRQARLHDKLYAPTRYPDALGDELPADVFGPEDGAAALDAAGELLHWAGLVNSSGETDRSPACRGVPPVGCPP
jgi:HEPN domain-containing protein